MKTGQRKIVLYILDLGEVRYFFLVSFLLFSRNTIPHFTSQGDNLSMLNDNDKYVFA